MSTAVGTHWRDLATPAFVVDLAKVTANAARMRTRAAAAAATLRPHVKTHKSREMLELLRAHGGVGSAIVVSTIAEAEFFAPVADDILLAVPFDPRKLDRTLAVARRVRTFGVTLDSPEALRLLVDGVAAAAAAAGTTGAPAPPTISVWVEVDTGYGRCGVDITASTADAVALVLEVTRAAPAVSFGGLYAHSGHSYNCCPEAGDPVASRVAAAGIAREEGRLAFGLARELAAAHGVAVPFVSLGATPSVSCGDGQWPPALGAPAAPSPRLELHPGNFTLYDRQQVASGSCARADIACFVVARVVGRYPARAELVLDCGSTALHKDPAGLRDGTWGELADHPDLVLTKLTQELAVVRARTGAAPLDCAAFPLGSAVRVLPNHACMAAAQHAVYRVIPGGADDGGGALGAGGIVCGEWHPAKFW